MTQTRLVRIQTPDCIIANDPARSDEQKIRDLHAMAADNLFRVLRLELTLESTLHRLDQHDAGESWDVDLDAMRTNILRALQEQAPTTN